MPHRCIADAVVGPNAMHDAPAGRGCAIHARAADGLVNTTAVPGASGTSTARSGSVR
jgi:hypothetical protein